MRHEISHHEEWYTCDRCGEKIEDIEIGKIFKRFPQKIRGKYEMMEIETLGFERTGYVSDSKLIIPDVMSIEITQYYREKRKQIHLCGKCRKKFEKFLKGECVSATNRT